MKKEESEGERKRILLAATAACLVESCPNFLLFPLSLIHDLLFFFSERNESNEKMAIKELQAEELMKVILVDGRGGAWSVSEQRRSASTETPPLRQAHQITTA